MACIAAGVVSAEAMRIPITRPNEADRMGLRERLSSETRIAEAATGDADMVQQVSVVQQRTTAMGEGARTDET
ncbi:MAG: hypothetical protein WBE20_14150 [Candidatus Acidiferrales bacterium]